MALSEDVKANFNTLKIAAKAGDLALLDCLDYKTGLSVPIIVAVNQNGQEYEMVPLAKMFTGNPYEEILPPIPGGGYAGDDQCPKSPNTARSRPKTSRKRV